MKHRDRWDLPKGHIDPGETDWDCALRELREETGILEHQIEPDFRFEFRLDYPVRSLGGERMKTLIVFLAKLLVDDVEIIVTEHLGHEWMPWTPPHRIQAKTIDPLLAAAERFLSPAPVPPSVTASASILPAGRILGIDYGSRRVGLAITDPGQLMAFPLELLTRTSSAADALVLQRVVKDQSITGLVVGLPLHMAGGEGESAMEARRFGNWVAQITNLPVVFQDERLSSAQADVYLEEYNFTKKKQKDRRDMLAAQVILQSWLERKVS